MENSVRCRRTNSTYCTYWIGLYTDSPCNACLHDDTTDACATCRNNCRWLDGEPYIFNIWVDNQPDDGYKYGALRYRHGYSVFVDRSSTNGSFYICKVKGNTNEMVLFLVCS